MFLPLGDAPNPRGVPWVTYGLIAANVAVYLFVSLPLSLTRPDPSDPAVLEYVRLLLDVMPGVSPAELVQQITAYDLFVLDHGFRPVAPQPVDLLASMFLHAGFMHLAGNMLFLWIYGDNVEHRLGPGRYLLAYLLTGGRRDPVSYRLRPRLGAPAGRRLWGDLGGARFLLHLVSSQQSEGVGVSVSVHHDRHHHARALRARRLSHLGQPPAFLHLAGIGRGRGRVRCAYRWIPRRSGVGLVGRASRSEHATTRVSSSLSRPRRLEPTRLPRRSRKAASPMRRLTTSVSTPNGPGGC